MIRELFAVGTGRRRRKHRPLYALRLAARRAHAAGFSGRNVHGQRSRPGSLLIGILLETTNSAAAGWLLTAGFCGGFTTFSTFSADAVRLLRAGDYGPATAYIALSVAVCIVFAALGMWIGAQIARN